MKMAELKLTEYPFFYFSRKKDESGLYVSTENEYPEIIQITESKLDKKGTITTTVIEFTAMDLESFIYSDLLEAYYNSEKE